MSKLLLHACCGPCAIMPSIRFLEEGFEPVLLFLNPNIHPLAEYMRRREGVTLIAQKLSLKILYADNEWNLHNWLASQLSVSNVPERCHNCVDRRMEATARIAKELGFQFFSSSLLYSRYQSHDHIAEYGKILAASWTLNFEYRDFRNDWQEGIDYSRKWEVYRQAYCGCIFSEAERYEKKFARLKNEAGKREQLL